MKDYIDFLKQKQKHFIDAGFEAGNLNPNLFDFQEYIVRLALKKGRFAVFADCGLGKTLIQLSWAYEVVCFTNKPVLILAPLAVSGQTIKEGQKFGINVKPISSYNPDEPEAGVFITNYEQLKKVETRHFSGVVLDESSILKNFTGKFKQLIISTFNKTPYKLACTATPSPNDVMELCNHAEFLNVGKRTEILAQYFIHDGGQTSKWKIKGHAAQRFYSFVSTWAIMLSKPSDIGYTQMGYELPKLHIEDIIVETPKKDNGKLFNDVNVSATDYNKELRITLIDRVEKAAEVVNQSDENWIVWVKQNEEGKEITKRIEGAIEVKGSDSPEYKEDKLLGFADNQFRVLVTKTKIAQYGLNYQNCSNQMFSGLDFSFESLYQAIRRSYRFGQQKEVHIYVITTDTMQNVLQAIKQKQEQFIEMKNQMYNSFKQQYNVSNL